MTLQRLCDKVTKLEGDLVEMRQEPLLESLLKRWLKQSEKLEDEQKKHGEQLSALQLQQEAQRKQLEKSDIRFAALEDSQRSSGMELEAAIEKFRGQLQDCRRQSTSQLDHSAQGLLNELEKLFRRSQEDLAQHKAACQQQLAPLQRGAEKSREDLDRVASHLRAECEKWVQQALAAAGACERTVKDQDGKLLTLQEELRTLRSVCKASEDKQRRLEESQSKMQVRQDSLTPALDQFREENMKACHESAGKLRVELLGEVEAKHGSLRQEVRSSVRTQAEQDQILVELRAAQEEQVRSLQRLREEQARRASALQESITQQLAELQDKQNQSVLELRAEQGTTAASVQALTKQNTLFRQLQETHVQDLKDLRAGQLKTTAAVQALAEENTLFRQLQETQVQDLLGLRVEQKTASAAVQASIEELERRVNSVVAERERQGAAAAADLKASVKELEIRVTSLVGEREREGAAAAAALKALQEQMTELEPTRLKLFQLQDQVQQVQRRDRTVLQRLEKLESAPVESPLTESREASSTSDRVPSAPEEERSTSAPCVAQEHNKALEPVPTVPPVVVAPAVSQAAVPVKQVELQTPAASAPAASSCPSHKSNDGLGLEGNSEASRKMPQVPPLRMPETGEAGSSVPSVPASSSRPSSSPAPLEAARSLWSTAVGSRSARAESSFAYLLPRDPAARELCIRAEQDVKEMLRGGQDPKEIKKKLRLEWHPDKSPHPQEIAKEVFRFVEEPTFLKYIEDTYAVLRPAAVRP